MENTLKCGRSAKTACECLDFVKRGSVASSPDGEYVFLLKPGQCREKIKQIIAKPADQIDEESLSEAKCNFVSEIRSTELPDIAKNLIAQSAN